MFHNSLLKPAPADAAQTKAEPLDWAARFATLATTATDPRLRAYYAAGAVNADTPLAEVPLTALDVETTGLDPVKDGIVSIGLVPMSLDCIRASASQQWLLKPRVALGAESVTIHGITDSQVRHAPDLDHILADLLRAMAGQVLVVHCRDIERQFLNGALRTRIGETIEFPVIDTMELEARLHRPAGRRPPSLWAQWFRRREAPLLSIRLAASRSRYHLPRYRLHHAPTDALASAELLQAQVAHHFTPQTPVSALWR